MTSSCCKREFRLEQFGITHHRPDDFTRCQWQRQSAVSVPYLVYRWLSAAYFLGSLVACISGTGHGPNAGAQVVLKWPIYVTSWACAVCTLQAVLAAFLVTSRARRERAKDYEAPPEKRPLPGLYKVYWVLHTCSVVEVLGITILYWVAVYDPELHILNLINIMVHAGNCAVLAIDFCLVSHPFRVCHFYWPVLFSAIYLVFSVTYFALGGTDKFQRHFIYPSLDWQRGAQSTLFAALGLVFVVGLHYVWWALYLLRRGCANKCADREEKLAKNSVDDSVTCSDSSIQLKVI